MGAASLLYQQEDFVRLLAENNAFTPPAGSVAETSANTRTAGQWAFDMKTYKNLYPQICDFTTLHSAYNKAKCLKRYREEVLKFSYRQEQELSRLRDELVRQAYTHGRYREFLVNDSKKRLIRAAPFRDRVVHKAVFMVLEPVFEPCFIFDSYACRTGKGTHKAVRRLETFLQSGGGGSVKGCVGFAM